MFKNLKHTIIIAEAGVNHNGSIRQAKQLIDIAAEAGADYVKFQSFKAETLVSESADLAEYQKTNTKDEVTGQFEMLKQLELSEAAHFELKAYAETKNIKFLSTAFDTDYVKFLYDLGIDFFKVPSGEITNLPYLEAIADTHLPVVISTGMADMDEIRDTLNVFLNKGYNKDNMVVLQCNTQYPTMAEDVNLNAMLSIHHACGVTIGFSDHTLGIEASLAAVALGAKVIEKHFTLDKNMQGPDHSASLEPAELKQLVTSIRRIEKMLGNPEKTPTESELPNKEVARKSIHAAKNLNAGDIIATGDLQYLRPGNGISPMEYRHVLGKKLSRNIDKGTLLKWEDFE